MKFVLFAFCMLSNQVCLSAKRQWSLRELFDIALESSHYKHQVQGVENEKELLSNELHKQFDVNVSHKLYYEKNENQSIGLYDPGERQKVGMNHSVRKNFSTGTSLVSELSLVESSAKSNELKTKGVEASFEVKVEQDVLKNRWGHDYRLSEKKNDISSKQKRFEQKKFDHDLFMEIVDAALLVEQKKLSYDSAYEALQRDIELAKIYRKKSQDGMISAEETLQIDSQLLQDRNTLEVRKLELVSAWFALDLGIHGELVRGEDVTGLGLNLPSPSVASQVCSVSSYVPYEDHPEYRVLSSKVLKSDCEIQKIHESLKPEGKIAISSRLNHVDEHAASALSQLGNPRWQVSLSFQYYFDQPEKNSSYRRKMYEKKMSEIEKDKFSRKILSEKKILCQTWKQQTKNHHNQVAIVQIAKKILEKSQQSYRNGILPFLSLSATEQSYIQKKESLGLLTSQMKQTQWKILYTLGYDLKNHKVHQAG